MFVFVAFAATFMHTQYAISLSHGFSLS
jgi:hypothetical protein